MFKNVKKLNICVVEYSPSEEFYLQMKRRKIRSYLFITANKKNNCTL